MLTGTYLFSYLDRQILVLLQEPIKHELNLSDTQLGVLSGFSFVLFYTVVGVFIARWIDRGVRRSILALCFAG